MKTKLTHLTTFTSLLLFCLLTFSTKAFIVMQDNFNYSNGDLIDVGGPGVPTNRWMLAYGNTNTAQVQVSGGQVIIPGSSLSDQPRSYFTNGLLFAPIANYVTNSIIYITNTTAAYFPSNSPIAALYASLTLNVPSATGLGSTYFAYFADTNFDFRCRLYIITNGASPGMYRIGVANASSPNPATNIVQQDLSPGNNYTVVGRYILNSGTSTVWVNPANEANSAASVTATSTGVPNAGGSTATSVIGNSTCAFGLRNAIGLTNLTLSGLTVGTTFADVVPSSAGANPPFIALQPADSPNSITNDNVTFSTLAGGDSPLNYQWYSITNSVTNAITDAIGSNLVLNAVNTNQTGFYFAIMTNNAGAITTRLAQLIVYPAPVAVVFSNQPQNLTVNVGDTATFSVVVGGVPPPTYQWSYVTNSGAVSKTNIIVGATSSTLTIPNINTNTIFTNVFVTAVNRVNSTNSFRATLTVNPVASLTIAQLRSMVDGTYTPTNTTSVFSIQGTVTTWTNLTTSGNCEFYIQDNTAGIAVFWSGAAASTNMPPAGATVKVIGPLAIFSGLLEIEPVFTNTLHTMKVVSVGNGALSLPAPQPLPFDPNVAGNVAQLKAMEGIYFVASNVTLAAGSTFISGANEPITANASNVLTAPIFGITFTNNTGETFDLFVNSHTDIPGQSKPSGPVTIYGVLSYFGNGTITASGFEFTPTRYADIISYNHVTNVLSNLTRPGDLTPNNFTESFLEPGETLTTFESVGDAAGGIVTLTPASPLPGSASWSGITSGLTGNAVFRFTPQAGDAGSNYVVSLAVNTTAGTTFTNSFTVYVPTPVEQQICISEFLANPTTNTAAPNFNPLHRPTDTIGVITNDEYVEIVNQSPTDYGLNSLAGIYTGNNTLVEDFSLNTPTLSSSNAIVVYGGNSGEAPSLPVYNEPATSKSLSLATSGTGTLILRNPNGNIIDRVIYSAANMVTNGSMTRFPNINSAFAPHPYVSINLTSAGLQYDGSAWNKPFKVPVGVPNVGIGVANGNVFFGFTANTSLASTLWAASTVTGPYQVIFGRQFPTTSGAFTNATPGPLQFYYISNQ